MSQLQRNSHRNKKGSIEKKRNEGRKGALNIHIAKEKKQALKGQTTSEY